jgi:hypothetical protein
MMMPRQIGARPRNQGEIVDAAPVVLEEEARADVRCAHDVAEALRDLVQAVARRGLKELDHDLLVVGIGVSVAQPVDLTIGGEVIIRHPCSLYVDNR